MDLNQLHVSLAVLKSGLENLPQTQGEAPKVLEKLIPFYEAVGQAITNDTYANSEEFKQMLAEKPGVKDILTANFAETPSVQTLRPRAQKVLNNEF